MNRRRFLGRSAAVAGAVVFRDALRADSSDRAGTDRLGRIGLELYSVRNEMKRDPEGTLAAVRAIGYDDVELLWSWNNFDRTTEQVKTSLERLGLRAPSAHIAPEMLLGDWERSVATARVLGHDYLIVPSLPLNMSLDEWKRWADRFNTAGETARKSGVWLALHSEQPQFKVVDGVVPYDLFVERTDPNLVRHQLDVGNMILGGVDPMAYLARYRDRYWSFHLKDVTPDRSSDTELGQGTFDFRSFLAAIPDLAHKPCYVEHENPVDPLASARNNYAYARRLEF